MFSAHFSVLLQNSFENVLVDFCTVLKWGNPKSKIADTRRLPFDSLDVIRRHMMSVTAHLGPERRVNGRAICLPSYIVLYFLCKLFHAFQSILLYLSIFKSKRFSCVFW